MNKVILILISISVFLIVSIGVRSANDPIVPIVPEKGKCYEVIEYLRESYKNDTLAINFFMDMYVVPKIKDSDTFYKKDVSEIIRFFNDPMRKNYYTCYIRGYIRAWKDEPVLLIK